MYEAFETFTEPSAREKQILKNIKLSAALDVHLQDEIAELEKSDLALGLHKAQLIQANKNKKNSVISFLVGFYNGLTGNAGANGNSVLKSKFRSEENLAAATTYSRTDASERMNYARNMVDKTNTTEGDLAKKSTLAATAELITKRDIDFSNPNSRDAKQAALQDIRNTSPEAIAARADLAARGQLSAALIAQGISPAMASALGAVALEQMTNAQSLGKSLSDKIVSTDMKVVDIKNDIRSDIRVDNRETTNPISTKTAEPKTAAVTTQNSALEAKAANDSAKTAEIRGFYSNQAANSQPTQIQQTPQPQQTPAELKPAQTVAAAPAPQPAPPPTQPATTPKPASEVVAQQTPTPDGKPADQTLQDKARALGKSFGKSGSSEKPATFAQINIDTPPTDMPDGSLVYPPASTDQMLRAATKSCICS